MLMAAAAAPVTLVASTGCAGCSSASARDVFLHEAHAQFTAVELAHAADREAQARAAAEDAFPA